jgi:hypothetical protein
MMSFMTPLWRSGKNQHIKILRLQIEKVKGECFMEIGAYFEVLKYILMTATFIALVLIFLYAFYGKEEKAS